MIQISKEELRELLDSVLKEHRDEINLPSHTEAHEFLKDMKPFLETWVKREARQQERWEKLKTSTIGFILFGILGTIGAVVLDYLHIKAG